MMARLHIDVSELAQDLDLALEQLARGNEVLLERAGEVVARLVLPTETPQKPTAARPQDMAAFATDAPQTEDAALANAMAVLRRAGEMVPTSLDAWDELSREEEFLEMLAQEMSIGEEGITWSGPGED